MMIEIVLWAVATLATVLALSSDSGKQVASQPDDLLGRLVGSWRLTGAMGSTALDQRVDAQWVIQGRFLQMRFVHEGPTAKGQVPYEAIYMLGYDAKSATYTLHLFDTFGATYAQTVGMGKRQGDSIAFLFDYPDGQFSNTFTWDRGTGRWEMLLRQRERTGEWKVFATKALSRK